MKYVLLIISLLLFQTSQAQPVIKPHVVKKTKRFKIANNCYFDKYWYEVVLPNKKAADSINNRVHKIFTKDYFTPSPDDCCDPQNEYSYDCEVACITTSFFSLIVHENNFYKGAQHGYTTFSTLNFNTTTGKMLSFSNMVLPEKKAALDSIMLQRLAMRYRCAGPCPFSEFTTEQLQHLDFKIEKNSGLVILFHMENFGAEIEQPWSFEELESFMKPEYLGY